MILEHIFSCVYVRDSPLLQNEIIEENRVRFWIKTFGLEQIGQFFFLLGVHIVTTHNNIPICFVQRAGLLFDQILHDLPMLRTAYACAHRGAHLVQLVVTTRPLQCSACVDAEIPHSQVGGAEPGSLQSEIWCHLQTHRCNDPRCIVVWSYWKMHFD